jgi:hypothetical protein
MACILNKEKLIQLDEERNSILFNKNKYITNMNFKTTNELLGSSYITKNNLINQNLIPFNFNYMDEF